MINIVGIRYVIVDTGHWHAGKEIVISPRHIDRISYEESRVFVSVSKESIQNTREYHMSHAAYHDSAISRIKLYEHNIKR